MNLNSLILVTLGFALSSISHGVLIAQYGFNTNTSGPWGVDVDPSGIASSFLPNPANPHISSSFGPTEGARWNAIDSDDLNEFVDLTTVNPTISDIVGSFSLTAPAGQKVMLDPANSVLFDFAMGDFDRDGNTSSGETVLFVASDPAFTNVLASSTPQLLSFSRPAGGPGNGSAGSHAYAQNIAINNPVMGTSLYFGVAIISDIANDDGSSPRYDNIRINGELVAIPEPSRALLGLVGLVSLVVRRRRA